jgi:hypothetical protein
MFIVYGRKYNYEKIHHMVGFTPMFVGNITHSTH